MEILSAAEVTDESNNKEILSNTEIRIIATNFLKSKEFSVSDFNILKASDGMIGFLGEYWKLTIKVNVNSESKILYFFLKSIPRSNNGKALMLREYNFFQKEYEIYNGILENLKGDEGPNIWRPKFIAVFENDIVFQDLNSIGYKMRDKLLHFDFDHLTAALKSLAFYHSEYIIFEENKSQETGELFRIHNSYDSKQSVGGYEYSSPWFQTCLRAALTAVRKMSKYGKIDEAYKKIEDRWHGIWKSALDLANVSSVYRNVLCHRDLWANNMLFHYDKNLKPNGCVFVDYQAASWQPPAGDVTLLIYINTTRQFRDNHFHELIHFYYNLFDRHLKSNNVKSVISFDKFVRCCEEQRKWALIVCACLIPQIWMDANLSAEIFEDSSNFDYILTKNKCDFIIEMMTSHQGYKDKVLEVMDEIVERFVL